MKKRALFLDRDGTLNKSVIRRQALLIRNGKAEAPVTLQEFKIFPEAARVTERIKECGYLLIVVTNQPDIASGKLTWQTLRRMNKHLKSQLPIDAIFVCPHGNESGCKCRKPKPGMLQEAARRFNINLQQSFILGDRATDVKAGKVVGVTTILFDPEREQASHLKKHGVKPDYTINNLKEAIKIICKQ